MKMLVAGVLVVVGLVVVLYGFGTAVAELVGRYSGALSDPLADAAEPKQVSAAMVRGVVIGAAGLLPLVVGSTIIKVALFRAARRKLKGR